MLLALPVISYAEQFHPKADPKSEVICGKARFTVLTDRLIRLEWAEDGVFEDNATLGIVNRLQPVPSFKVNRGKHSVTITTPSVRLVYNGDDKFNEKNLSVSFKLNGKKVEWRPGMSTEGNLLGTARTLDRFKGDKTIDPYDLGVCSRDGWAVIDESTRHLLKPVAADWQYWVAERPAGERQDWYLFAYGHDYKSAVGDFTKIAGNIPMPPKYAFGYWWCRYWMYTDSEINDLVEHFHDFSLPIDAFIIDMDWHKTWGVKSSKDKDAAGENLGWTGYTWDEVLFPDPAALLHGLQNDNIQTSLNLHPASGIMPFEEPYKCFVEDYLSRTADYDGPRNYVDSTGNPVFVPFRMSQMEWADAYFNTVIRPIEKQGVSFWWLDWQQFIESRYVKGLSNTFWLNYTFWNDMARQSSYQGDKAPRPMIYHRWGGIGSHRYQVGFSGDTYATWKVLGALPYFTYTASNVGYCYWGHDIGGHMQPKGVRHTDPELYTRWMQSGVFTPIYKSHSTKDTSMEKRFWVFPEHFDAMREAIRLRYDLAPYIYTAAREAFDTGVGLCRPLYYEYPETEEAYTEKEEFFFGPDILATTVCNPVDSVSGLAPRHMWFPAGNAWFDVSTGTMYKGGSTRELSYTVDENPWFVKAGSVIPLSGKKIMSLQDVSNELRLRVIPGEDEFTTTVYEDDGKTQAYASAYATTAIHKTYCDGVLKIAVAPRKGTYSGAPSTRRLSVELECFAAPEKVCVNGVEQQYEYDGKLLRTTVSATESSVDEETVFEIYTSGKTFVAGQRGLLCRMSRMSEEGKMAYNKAYSRYFVPTEFMRFTQAGSIISATPSNAEQVLNALNPDALTSEMEGCPKLDKAFMQKALAQMKIYLR